MKIRDHEIGKDGVYIIAEAGSNHAGDLRYARALVKAAADAGCDAVKFQRFRVYELEKTGQYKEPILKKLTKLELPDRWLPVLRDLAHELGLAFICTPFDVASVTVLSPFVDAWKIRHTDWNNRELTKAIDAVEPEDPLAKGRAYIGSIPVERWAMPTDWCPHYVLYCNPHYPTPLDNLHLPTFTAGDRYGLSDHTLSLMTGALAVARGACVLEKHFMLAGKSQSYLDRIVDTPVSLTPDRLAKYVINVRNAERAIAP